MLFMGVDVGTQGVRAVVADEHGGILCQAHESFKSMGTVKGAMREQFPGDWWEGAAAAIGGCVSQLSQNGREAKDIVSIAVDATSGTILLLDNDGKPLTDGIMYNDARALDEAQEVSRAAAAYERKLGYKFNSSYALPKLLWLKRHQPRVYGRAGRMAHQCDYIVGKLTGDFSVTDFSNALKTGYDIVDGGWPGYIAELGIDPALLPRVTAPGEQIGRVGAEAAIKTGLARGTVVTGGATDGYASALSAGAALPGEWASIIGTTLVLKGVTKDIVKDDLGRVYCHRHPDGYYMPGGASNAGGRCLNEEFGSSGFKELDAAVPGLIPTGGLIYPLSGTGERFPFVDANAKRFIVNAPSSREGLYAAYLEGVGYAERMAFSALSSLGCEVGDTVYAVGGAAKSPEWLKIRASILNKELKVPETPEAALGSAVLAASRVCFSSAAQAVKSMVRIKYAVGPEQALVRAYRALYEDFLNEIKLRFDVEVPR